MPPRRERARDDAYLRGQRPARHSAAAGVGHAGGAGTRRRRLFAGVLRQNIEGMLPGRLQQDRSRAATILTPVMTTDSISVQHGVAPGSTPGVPSSASSAGSRIRSTRSSATRWARAIAMPSAHAGHPGSQGLLHYEYLGNMGTVSLPLTAALAGGTRSSSGLTTASACSASARTQLPDAGIHW